MTKFELPKTMRTNMYFLEEEREKQKQSLTINCHSIANTHRTIRKMTR
jgi:hypothetical protein